MTQPLEGRARLLVTVGLSLAVFMQILDSTIANVALPTIAGNLGAAVSQGAWVITSFAVANAVTIPFTGFLAKRLGEARLFLISTALFIIASWLCGIAVNLPMLILCRVLQGACSGPMLPLAQSLLLSANPPEKRNLAMSIWSLVVIVAPICGPILGGYISEHLPWGWIFFINIPVGLTSLFICWKILGGTSVPEDTTPIDKCGILLMVIGVGAFQLMLDRGRELAWFESAEIIILAVVSVVALSYFLLWELGEKHPIIALSLFKNRNFSIGVGVSCIGFMIYLGSVVLIPQVLQINYGYTAITAGLATAPIGFFPLLLAPVLGKYGRQLDMRVLVTVSFLVFACSFIWRAYSFNLDMAFTDVVLPQLLQGIGVAFFFMPLTTIIFSQLEAAQIAAAASLSNFLRVLSGGVGTTLMLTLWDRRQIFHHARLTENYNPFNPELIDWWQNLAAMGLNRHDEVNMLANQIITQQSSVMAANDIFYNSAVLFLFLLIFIWLAKKT